MLAPLDKHAQSEVVRGLLFATLAWSTAGHTEVGLINIRPWRAAVHTERSWWQLVAAGGSWWQLVAGARQEGACAAAYAAAHLFI